MTLSPKSHKKRRLALLAILLLAGIAAAYVFYIRPFGWKRHASPPPSDVLMRTPISISIGKLRPPLQYRIVSFHRGRADKRLIRLASQLGFNGVQIQLEGSTVDGIKQFAERDAKEHLVDFCHQLGMQVTVWVHELSDVPAPWMPEWLGPVKTDNPKLWAVLDKRYEWVLRDAIPNVDGLVLTVVETQVRATDTDVMLKLAGLLRDECSKYNKSLQVRTFVWYPEEFETVMGAVNRLPPDTVIMSKCVPQDWQMRGAFASEIGNVGGRPQIEEYDVLGEYFLRDRVANCMPELLKKHFDYGLKHGISGICVRVDRDDQSVLHQPSEVNLWALGMMAAGASDDPDEIWKAWATNRFGAPAAEGVIRALKPTQDVVAELLSIGPFTFGDTRRFPALGEDDIFGDNWQNWRWDKSYLPAKEQAEVGDESFTDAVQASKAKAREQAEQCLKDLEVVKDKLGPEDYAILKTKLMTNQVQLEFRTPMAMAVLHYRRMMNADDEAERLAMDEALKLDLDALRAVAKPVYGAPKKIAYLGVIWEVGPPAGVPREWIFQWAYQMDELRRGEDPRPAKPVRGTLGIGK